MKTKLAAVLCAFLFIASITVKIRAEDTTVKQPVFLFCPGKEHLSAWSIYVTVDKADHSKIVNMGLEELSGKNSKDDGGYDKVLKAQMDPNTPRVSVATLADKSGGTMTVAQDRALNVTITPDGDNYKLSIDLRISVDNRFEIGGASAAKRNLVMKYNKFSKEWHAYASALENVDGRNVAAGGDPLMMTGIAFPVTASGIYRILAVLAGGVPVMIYDK